ncbi:hypothetical protein ABT160_06015 [Streptomyces sp. NPDC001941]|uniref:hypothetical protein n=1 Tax=Streptomyces sp. NPDC001941 TaxID=3154659 RepID=UPI00332F219B
MTNELPEPAPSRPTPSGPVLSRPTPSGLTVRSLVTGVLVALVALALWAAWLGWDQQRDVHPDGSVSGPYEAWQVIGLGVTLLALVLAVARRGEPLAVALGTAAGLTGAAYYDWSDDTTGLFGVGVALVLLGGLAGSVPIAYLAARTRRS